MIDKKKRCMSMSLIFLITLFIFCSYTFLLSEKIKSNDNMIFQMDNEKEINELKNGNIDLEKDDYYSASCMENKEEKVYYCLTEQVAYLEDQNISEVGEKKNGNIDLEKDDYYSVSCIENEEEKVHYCLTEQVAYLEDQDINEIGEKK